MNVQQRYSLIVALITCFVAPFMTSALNLCITDISTDFQCGATTVTWVVNAYTLCTAIFSMPLGHLADIKGRKPFLVLGTAIFGLASAGAALAPNVWVLIIARVLMSFGTSTFLAGNISILLASFRPDEKGRLIGLTITSTFVGVSIGPVLGGLIADFLGWRWIFWMGVVVAVVAVVLSVLKIENDRIHGNGGFDIRGNALFMAGIALLMFGLSEWTELPFAWAIALAGVVVGVLFVINELRVEEPMIQIRLFATSKAYGFANLASLLSYGATFGMGYVMAIYLQNVNGLESSVAGLALLAQPVVQAILSPFAGRLSDRIPSFKVAAFGAFVTILGIGILAFCGMVFPVWLIIICTVIVGIGNSYFASPNNNTILSCVDVAHYSEANAIINTGRGIGQSLSLVVVSVVFGLTVGNTVIEQADPALLAQAIGIMMMIATGAAIASAVLSLFSGHK